MWCIPHPKKSDHTLILLDTEGMGDVEKVEENSQFLHENNDPLVLLLSLWFMLIMQIIILLLTLGQELRVGHEFN